MEQFLRDQLQLVITPAILIGAFTYLSKKVIELTFSKNLDKFKIELQADANMRLFEFQTQYSQLHQKRVEIVGQLYEMLSKTVRDIADLTKPIQMKGGAPLVEMKELTARSFNNLSEYFSAKRIYFSEELCTQIDETLKAIRDAFLEFDTAHSFGMQNSAEYKPDATGLWVQAWKTVEQQLPPLLKAVEAEFRRLLFVK